MKPETHIDTLLRKYEQAPGFPFHDWTTNAVSFYALMSLWDEVFKTAAGQRASDFEALRDAQMDKDSLIYDVGTRDRTRRVNVYPEQNGGTFNLFFHGTTGGDLLGQNHLPDRSSLGFATDLQRDRLVACFEIIRAYLSTPLTQAEMVEDLDAALIKSFRHVFGFPDFDPFADHDETGRYVAPRDP